MSDIDEDELAAKRQAQQQDRRKQSETDMAWVLSTKQGRRVIARILDRCGVDAAIFQPNGSQMTHAEGRRSIGVEILAELKADHRAEWLRMIDETTP
jgi:hypothetical protein